MKSILLIALAGGVGSLARYGVSNFVQKLAGKSFPLGTLTVNLLGCFLFGLVVALAEVKRIPPEAKLVLLAGFMGAFTTFSTFGFESMELLDNQQWLKAGVNIAAQVLLGVACVFAGMRLGKMF